MRLFYELGDTSPPTWNLLIPPRVPKKPVPYCVGTTPAFAAEDVTEFNHRFCDLCKDDGAERDFGTPISGDGTINGPLKAEYIVPAVCDLIVTQCLVAALRKTDFRGYAFYPYHLYNYTPVKQPATFGMYGVGSAHNEEAIREYYRQYPSYCVKCHWGPETCPRCLGVASECPRCGSSEFEYVGNPPIVDTSCWITVDCPWGTESYVPLDCECWDGSDFLEGRVISGRVAKWLVENQYGPTFLIPYPADETRCTKEQCEQIEKN